MASTSMILTSTVTAAATSTVNSSSTNKLAGSSTVNSKVTAVANASFSASSSPSSQKKLSDQAMHKLSSEVDTLVDLGKEGGTSQISKEEVKKYIAQKITELCKNAEKPENLSSVRSDLCKLSRISSDHYAEQKEEIFNQLIRFIENDPTTQPTSNGVLNIVIELNSDLDLSKVQRLTISLQKKIAKAFSSSVELYLRHYYKRHVNAVMESLKKELLATQKSFFGLNTQKNEAIEFANQMALEASKRMTSDNSLFMEVLKRLTSLVAAGGMLFDKDLSGFFSELKKTFEGIEDKIKKEWFEDLFILKELIRKAPNEITKIEIIHKRLLVDQKNRDWKFFYGALEILREIALHNDDINVLSYILLGHSPSTFYLREQTSVIVEKESDCTTFTTKKENNLPIRSLDFPGIVKFLKDHSYVRKATVIQESDKMADEALQTISKELLEILNKKLFSKAEGKKFLYRCDCSDCFDYNNKPAQMPPKGCDVSTLSCNIM